MDEDNEYFADKRGSMDALLYQAFLAGVKHGRDLTPMAAGTNYLHWRSTLTP